MFVALLASSVSQSIAIHPQKIDRITLNGDYTMIDCYFINLHASESGILSIKHANASLHMKNSLFADCTNSNTSAGVDFNGLFASMERLCFRNLSAVAYTAFICRSNESIGSQISIFNVPSASGYSRRYPILFSSSLSDVSIINSSYNYLSEECSSILFADCGSVHVRQIISSGCESGTYICFYVARTLTGNVDQLILFNNTQHSNTYPHVYVTFDDNSSSITNSIFFNNSAHSLLRSNAMLFVIDCVFDRDTILPTLSIYVQNSKEFLSTPHIVFSNQECFPITHVFTSASSLNSYPLMLLYSHLTLMF